MSSIFHLKVISQLKNAREFPGRTVCPHFLMYGLFNISKSHNISHYNISLATREYMIYIYKEQIIIQFSQRFDKVKAFFALLLLLLESLSIVFL